MGVVAETVKRRYANDGRRAGSRATRQRIVEAARALMLERGYRGTTVADIADGAGVHVDTVYALVGRKAVVLRELIEQAISGVDGAVDAEERDYVKAIRAEASARGKLGIYAAATRAIHTRMGPLFLSLRDASTTEPEAEDVWREISDRRAANMGRLARDLEATGELRAGLSLEEVADVIWVTNSIELHTLLTVDRGWSADRYERWLADSWCRLLLADP